MQLFRHLSQKALSGSALSSLARRSSQSLRCLSSSDKSPSVSPLPAAASEIFNSDLFKSKTVFVTGGGSGINLGVVKGYASLGANIAICGRTQSKLEDAAAEIKELHGVEVYTHAADVREVTKLEEAFAGAYEKFGSINTVVAGAAGNFLSPVNKVSANGFKTVVDIDLLGSYNTAKAAFQYLTESKGDIIFISAGQGHVPYYAQAPAGAAKAGIENLMRNLALEWGAHGIRSNSIVPGPIEGTVGMKKLGPQDPKLLAAFMKSIPAGRYGRAEDVANAAIFLSSPLATYISGASIFVDGGQNLPGSGLFSYLMEQEMKRQKRDERT